MRNHRQLEKEHQRSDVANLLVTCKMTLSRNCNSGMMWYPLYQEQSPLFSIYFVMVDVLFGMIIDFQQW
jgi:hypothetical protein